MKKNRNGFMLIKPEATRDIHLTLMAKMDNEINVACLEKAIAQGVGAFALFNDKIVYKNGEAYFEENLLPIVVLNRQEIARPESQLANYHSFSFSYYKDTLKFCFSHVLTDGSGGVEFFKTVIYYYCCYYYNNEYSNNNIRLNNGQSYKDSETDFWDLNIENVEPVKENIYHNSSVALPSGTSNEIEYIKVSVQANELINFTKANECSPSIIAPILFAKALYRIYPNLQEPIVYRIPMNVRQAFECPNTQVNFCLPLHVSISKVAFEQASLHDLFKNARIQQKEQMTPNYLKFLAKKMVDENSFAAVSTACSSNYMGKIDFGTCSKHVVSLDIYEGTTRKFEIYELNGVFNFIMLFGENTQCYTDAFVEELKKCGLSPICSEKVMVKSELN